MFTCALRATVFLLAAAAFLALPAENSIAGSAIHPDTFLDDSTVNGNCSLREAIRSANLDTPIDACLGGSGADTIELAAGTYTLSIENMDGLSNLLSGDLNIYTEMTIAGAGSDETTIDAAGIDSVMWLQFDADLRLSGVTITGGQPDGVAASGMYVSSQESRAQLLDVIVTGNNGSPAVGNSGTMRILQSEIVSNVGIGVSNHGDLEVEDSAIQANTQQGFFNRGQATIERSLISHNGRVGFETDQPGTEATFRNVTISGNVGGVRHEDGSSTFEFVTIADNTLDRIAIDFQGGQMQVSNSIIAEVPGSVSDVCRDPITSLGHNIATDGTCGLDGPGDQPNTDPKIGPLANNLGSIFSHALLEDSPAIDAAADDCPPEDQRSFPRPDGLACDIGAYESSFGPPDDMIQGDLNCDGEIDLLDLDLLLQFVAQLHSGATPGGCPNLALLEPITGFTWGDLNCDGNIDGSDALLILLFMGELDLPDPIGGCFLVGNTIT